MTAEQDGRMSESRDWTAAERVSAEYRAQSVMCAWDGKPDPTASTLGPLLAELDRLRAIEAAVGPVIEKWAWLDPDDLDDIARATSVEWVKAVQELVRVAAVVVRGDES